MNIFSAVAFALVATALLVTIREVKKEYAVVLSVCAGAVLLISMLSQITPVLEQFTRFLESTRLELAIKKYCSKRWAFLFWHSLGVTAARTQGRVLWRPS